MKKMIIMLVIISCGRPLNPTQDTQTSSVLTGCTIVEIAAGADVTCNGTTVTISNGRSGLKGDEGKEGIEGGKGERGEQGEKGENGGKPTSCTISATDTGAAITCGDNTVVINNGTAGADGVDGNNGADGNSGVNGTNGTDGKGVVCTPQP